MREHDLDRPPVKFRRRRFDDDEPVTFRRRGGPAPVDLDGRAGVDIDGPPTGDRWSTWTGAMHGPRPRPPWVITDHAAIDTELGVLKTGKEADVHLLERAVPDDDRRVLLAAKRYRSAEHRMFHRDAGYTEGRRVRSSREMRAMARRTEFGRDLLAGQWAAAEFAALARLWADGVAVPYPVQLDGTELLIEFVGSPDGSAAPRLAQLRPDPALLADLWRQLSVALRGLARHGLTHGDLSAYNLLVHSPDGVASRLVVIDLPQVVDVIGNPQGPAFLARDVARVAEWFAARGLPDAPGEAGALLEELCADLRIPPESVSRTTSHP
ncbi:RIO1 family regulatory kinase/ATPase domain-containing protein [Pseudonocardia charpentierae]|uniref:non-specific serine/threonine protein kinase n=1 Tax=Pseudonocardia charpentierae TaxID=3075545 RepID=A0ABU2NAM9_9PSEU|nr:RIO1 family regulatory kinase/ATPase [Pseudonocardia sp. DSM 45834]MDT0351000.1 RIO1 family regulatory kinase/ATPase [Pseudonocardia sp. DSM 45834]